MHLHKEIIYNYISAYNSYDIESMLSLLHPEVLFTNISGGKVSVQTEGRDAFEKLARQSAEVFKERQQKIVSYEEVDNKVNVEVHYHAKVVVDLPNGSKSSDNINMRGRSEFVIKDGLIYSVLDKS